MFKILNISDNMINDKKYGGELDVKLIDGKLEEFYHRTHPGVTIAGTNFLMKLNLPALRILCELFYDGLCEAFGVPFAKSFPIEYNDTFGLCVEDFLKDNEKFVSLKDVDIGKPIYCEEPYKGWEVMCSDASISDEDYSRGRDYITKILLADTLMCCQDRTPTNIGYIQYFGIDESRPLCRLAPAFDNSDCMIFDFNFIDCKDLDKYLKKNADILIMRSTIGILICKSSYYKVANHIIHELYGDLHIDEFMCNNSKTKELHDEVVLAIEHAYNYTIQFLTNDNLQLAKYISVICYLRFLNFFGYEKFNNMQAKYRFFELIMKFVRG